MKEIYEDAKKIPTFLPLKRCAEESGIALYWWRLAVKNNWVPNFKSGNKYYVEYEEAINRIRDRMSGGENSEQE